MLHVIELNEERKPNIIKMFNECYSHAKPNITMGNLF